MNKIDYKKLLAELGDDLKNSTSNLKQELSNIKSLYTRIKNYVNSAQSLVDKITDEESGLDKILTNAQNLESQISTLKVSADTNLASITTSLTTIQSHIAEMESAYSAFFEINKKITDEESGLDKILTNAQNLESQISTLKVSADTNLASITTSLTTIQSHIAEMESAYINFTAINDKITNKETGLEAILAGSDSLKSDIEATKTTSETIFKAISKLKDTASAYVNDIKALSESAKETVQKITRNHEESEELKKKINNIFNISSQRAHANYFDSRQKILALYSILWLILALFCLALTIYFGDKYIYPLVSIIGNGEKEIIKTVTIEAFLIRLGLITPLIVSTIYCFNQFSKERRLHEQYAFKAVSMLSIESSVALLFRSLKAIATSEDKETKITTFALNTLESVYKDPNETTKRSIFFSGGNELLKLSGEIHETIGEIKEKLIESTEKIKK